jgi:hypothetical protein
MCYNLHRLAPGSYDLSFNGKLVGSVVRNVSYSGAPMGWSAELMDEVQADQRPAPFSGVEHPFRSLDAVIAWLGGATISAEPGHA